jgi:anti-sigma factor RsiW
VDCLDVRDRLLDFQQGRLAPELVGGVQRHLDGCADCRLADLAERELSHALERRTPQYSAPLALKRRLAAAWPAPAPPRARGHWLRVLHYAAVAAAALLLALPFTYELVSRKDAGAAVMVTEAVNDHVRMLQSQRPLEIESGGIHQVIPWFSGKLDFAPGIRFAGDAEFPLRGGAVGYFVDRKAAALAFGEPSHAISLFVFKADGLPWPTRGLERDTYRTTARGFNVLLWHDGELGYALVGNSDADLMRLAAKLRHPA